MTRPTRETASVPTGSSYWVLLQMPHFSRFLLGVQLTLIGKQMTTVALILFSLALYGSSELAGLVAFANVFPGLVLSPLAGALLDRHGCVPLILADLCITSAALVCVGILAGLGALPPWLLIGIVGLSSLTSPLSDAGVRSLVPLLVAPELRARANALDSNVSAVASLLGPPLGGAAIQLLGPIAGLVSGSGLLLVGAVLVRTTRDRHTGGDHDQGLWTETLAGVGYVWRNRTLRGLALTYTPISLIFGVLAIVVPVLVLQHLQLGPAVVGGLFGVQGGAGIVGALLGGRSLVPGRALLLLTLPGIFIGLALLVVVISPSLPALAAAIVAVGVLQSMMVVALFTVRQERAEPAWWGRTFAISTAVNRAGNPVGSALAGRLAAASPQAALLIAVGAGVLSSVLAWSTLGPQLRPPPSPTR